MLGVAFVATSCGGQGSGSGTDNAYWTQWSYSPAHDGQVSVVGASLDAVQADIIYDPFVSQEQAESGGGLVVHYPSALTDGSDFYFETKSGTYTSCFWPDAWQYGAACGPNTWDQMVWNVAHYTWQSGSAVPVSTFVSDWKPPPNGQGLSGWEPVFHPALANGALYVPGAGGTIWRVSKDAVPSALNINPFANTTVNPAHAFVTGPLTVDSAGNIYFNVVELSASASLDPWTAANVVSAWLVKVTPQDTATKVSYSTLVPGAPPATATTCAGEFTAADPLPWPPSPSAQPASMRCGSQRPGINVSPAIGPDGTIFTVSRAHFDEQTAYLVALNPDLTPKWHASLEHRLNDGCGVLVPIAADLTTPNACRPGSTVGVDPRTNALGSGHVTDLSSSTPVALPDGGVLYGALTYYNAVRGHLLKFDDHGRFIGSYPFGWDTTPALFRHGTTYSIVVKDNHYDAPLYCFNADPHCLPLPAGPYLITQLDSNLNVEWQFQNTTRDADHPNGYEWCINAPVVDVNGVVYVNGEDGYAYAIDQGHKGLFTTPLSRQFLRLAEGAAYTPLSLGPDGRVYAQSDGHLFALGN